MKTSLTIAALLASPALYAAVITYNFDGSVSGGMPPPSILGAFVHTGGTPFAGHFTYDSTTPVIGSGPNFATYALTELHLTFNPSTLPETIIISGGNINVVNDPTFGDRLEINAGIGGPPSPGFTGGFNLDFHGVGLFYDDPSGSVFSSTSLPGSDLTEASFPFPGSYVFSYSDPGSFGTFDADGTLDNLSAPAIPEPSSTALVLGAIGLGLMRRRR